MYNIKHRLDHKLIMLTEIEMPSYASPREQVTRTISEWIRTGILSPGAALPPENVISEQLKVARGTVRSGLDELEKNGVITKINRRRYVHREQRQAAPNLIADTVMVLGISSDNPLRYKDTGYMDAVQAGSLEQLMHDGLHSLNLQTAKLNEQVFNQLLSLSPRGALMFQDLLRSERGKAILRLLKKNFIPVVVDYEYPATLDCDRVLSDHFQGNYLLTRKLIDRGYRRILSFVPDSKEEFWLERKRAGYLQALREAGLNPLPPPPAFKWNTPVNAWDREAFDNFVRGYAGHLVEYFTSPEPPDAVMVVTDWDVPLVSSAIRLFGKTPGRDVAIVGYDNKSSSCHWNVFAPDLPAFTVDKRNTETGRRMVEILRQRLAGQLPPEPAVQLVAPQIIENKA